MEELSSYEIERAAKIARNKAVLASLGLQNKNNRSPISTRKSYVQPRAPSRDSYESSSSQDSSASISDASYTPPIRRSGRAKKTTQTNKVKALTTSSRRLAKRKEIATFLQSKKHSSTFHGEKSSTLPRLKVSIDEPVVSQTPRKVLEYEVTLERGHHGYCINLGIMKSSISVVNFRRPVVNRIGPAEACQKINPGDKLVSINGNMLFGGEDFKRRWPSFNESSSITLGFRRLLPLE